MIKLIREDGIEFLLNSNLIEKIENGVYTVITLTGGEELRVKNSQYDIIEKIKAYMTGIREDRDNFKKKLSKEEKG